jgi:hypothetical protein
VSTFTTEQVNLTAGYDNTSDFPTEPAGWGLPGQVRHAEAIGHGVWLAEHPDPSTDEIIAASRAARAELATAVAASKASRLFEEPEAPMCPIHDCARKDHPVFEMCEDAFGHTWFQGDHTGGIQL